MTRWVYHTVSENNIDNPQKNQGTIRLSIYFKFEITIAPN